MPLKTVNSFLSLYFTIRVNETKKFRSEGRDFSFFLRKLTAFVTVSEPDI